MITLKSPVTIQVKEIFKRLSKEIKNPRTELNYSTPFQFLVAVLLSAQATDRSVNKATPKLFQKAETAEAMRKLETKEILEYIREIGLAPTKSRHIKQIAEILLKDYQDQIPRNINQLLRLPGIGLKGASLILNTLYHQPIIAVDTHVHRLTRRLGWIETKRPDQAWRRLNLLIPRELRYDAHHYLVLHGRYTCKARRPNCSSCPICDLCALYKTETAETVSVRS